MASRKTGYKSKPHYKNELEAQKSPKRVAKRVEQNRARREAIKSGKAKVGDGKDVHHKKSLIGGVKKARTGGTTLMDRGSNRSNKPKGIKKPGPKKGSSNRK